MTRRFPPKVPCADCGRPCNGKRCRPCFLRSLPPRVDRPAYSWAERKRRKHVVETHRAQYGDVCPGWQIPAHPVAHGDKLTADHVTPYAISGDEGGPLAVLCGKCNSAKRDGRNANPWRRRAQRRKPPAVEPAQPRSGVPVGEDKHQPRTGRRFSPLTATTALVPEEDEPAEMPEPPENAKDAGRQLWTGIVSRFDLAPHELELLRQAVGVLDTCDELAAIVEAEGLMVPVLPHGTKPNPALVELRAQRITFGRLMAALQVPMGEEKESDEPRRTQRRSGFRGPYRLNAEQRAVDRVVAGLGEAVWTDSPA